MNITEAPLQGILIIQPRLFSDDRGFFYESHQQNRYLNAGIPLMVQDNISRSKKDTLRGLHFQMPHSQGKLVWVIRGKVWDVMVDIRRSSPTYKKWFALTLSDETPTQIYIPPGFAHGFCTLSDEADFCYKCTDYYSPQTEHGIIWNDPELKIEWPVDNPILSPKDKLYPTLKEINHAKLFA
ncbi:MAG TPA: dTDP-4-dehydrorhamnose 3,5-epimerase [Gammaproteobacteria bacterium]|jgi:dTDP-4-dehydrorhamnose 3,5-epimerase|nr:dTDP-4-dehydrorhamnose 3,5-epimerase [Gammaproteobacteria bacterium]